MESEEYYDSLDESDDDIIPFYDKPVNKSKIDLTTNTSKSSVDTIQTPKCKKDKDKTNFPVFKSKNESYLEMYYAKNGIPNINLSERATCYDLSPRSWATCEYDCDGNSLYFKSDSSDSSYGSVNLDLALSLTSIDSKLESISECNFNMKPIKTVKPFSTYQSATKLLPEMGKLGPDIRLDKLELYRKRQQYGKRVSQENKIKMIEKRTIQILEQEIKNSNINLCDSLSLH